MSLASPVPWSDDRPSLCLFRNSILAFFQHQIHLWTFHRLHSSSHHSTIMERMRISTAAENIFPHILWRKRNNDMSETLSTLRRTHRPCRKNFRRRLIKSSKRDEPNNKVQRTSESFSSQLSCSAKDWLGRLAAYDFLRISCCCFHHPKKATNLPVIAIHRETQRW